MLTEEFIKIYIYIAEHLKVCWNHDYLALEVF